MPPAPFRPCPIGTPAVMPNEELKPTAHLSEAAGSLRSPAAFYCERRGLTPAR